MSELSESLKKCRIEGDTLFLPPISDGMLPNYNEVRIALLKAGAKYKKNTFVFPNDAQPYIDRLTGGESVNIAKEFQFYPTPNKIADKLVELAEIEIYHTILEPSAGHGAIIDAICRKDKTRAHSRKVECFELMDINRDVLNKKENCILTETDFLKIGKEYDNCYDRIIANPPFTKNQDINHILKMYDCLKKGGRLVSLASTHYMHSSNKKETEFKQWLKKVGADEIKVAAGEFKQSDTNIATVIIVINK